jgi:hypothetical protein
LNQGYKLHGSVSGATVQTSDQRRRIRIVWLHGRDAPFAKKRSPSSIHYANRPCSCARNDARPWLRSSSASPPSARRPHWSAPLRRWPPAPPRRLPPPAGPWLRSPPRDEATAFQQGPLRIPNNNHVRLETILSGKDSMVMAAPQQRPSEARRPAGRTRRPQRGRSMSELEFEELKGPTFLAEFLLHTALI